MGKRSEVSAAASGTATSAGMGLSSRRGSLTLMVSTLKAAAVAGKSAAMEASSRCRKSFCIGSRRFRCFPECGILRSSRSRRHGAPENAAAWRNRAWRNVR